MTRLHTVHNLQLIDLDADGRDEVVLAAWEGVFVLRSGLERELVEARRSARATKDRSRTRGRARSRSAGSATASGTWRPSSPGTAFQVVVYSSPKSGDGLWDRQVIDEPVKWGHAVWCVDLDGDGDDEILIGQRDPNAAGRHDAQRAGVYAYDPKPGSDRSPSTVTSSTTAGSPSRTSSPATSTATAGPTSSPEAGPRTTSRSTGTRGLRSSQISG